HEGVELGGLAALGEHAADRDLVRGVAGAPSEPGIAHLGRVTLTDELDRAVQLVDHEEDIGEPPARGEEGKEGDVGGAAVGIDEEKVVDVPGEEERARLAGVEDAPGLPKE